MRKVTEQPFVSIIIPALNESAHIARTLATIEDPSRSEVILVDGGSRDETPDLAESWGAKLLVSQEGRAKQMNTGAAEAQGSILLFLHADTRLPKGFDDQILLALTSPGIAAGAFRLRFDGRPSPLLRVIEWTANWRSQYLQMPFGDQGIFLPKDLFVETGGFKEIPIMEDVELIRRLKRKGRIFIVPSPVVTSSRRYEASGILKRMLINKAARMGYYMGVSPWRIVRWYDR